VLLTSRGKGVAVLQSLEDFERTEEECYFMRAVVRGSIEIDAGQGIPIEEVKHKLGL